MHGEQSFSTGLNRTPKQLWKGLLLRRLTWAGCSETWGRWPYWGFSEGVIDSRRSGPALVVFYGIDCTLIPFLSRIVSRLIHVTWFPTSLRCGEPKALGCAQWTLEWVKISIENQRRFNVRYFLNKHLNKVWVLTISRVFSLRGLKRFPKCFFSYFKVTLVIFGCIETALGYQIPIFFNVISYFLLAKNCSWY